MMRHGLDAGQLDTVVYACSHVHVAGRPPDHLRPFLGLTVSKLSSDLACKIALMSDEQFLSLIRDVGERQIAERRESETPLCREIERN